ncbi:RNA-dependent RNA polymerase [Crithidia bombi leishbuvirus 1]|nr:RNA-dependent RNA polymerase [Crithidia bombi leishbuvirus 1]
MFSHNPYNILRTRNISFSLGARREKGIHIQETKNQLINVSKPLVQAHVDNEEVNLEYFSIYEKMRLQILVGEQVDKVNIRNIAKLPHEWLCLYLFGGESTTALQEYKIWDEVIRGKSTPDFHQIYTDQLVVLEVKTTRMDSGSSYVPALNQYKSILSVCKLPVHLFALCVCPTSAHWTSGLELSGEQIENCGWIVKMAQEIQDQVRSLGHKFWSIEGDDLKCVVIPEVPKIKSSQNKLLITDEMREFWQSQSGDVNFSQVLVDHIKEFEPIANRRSRDEKFLKLLYSDANMQPDPMRTLKLGFTIASREHRLKFPNGLAIENAILNELFSQFMDRLPEYASTPSPRIHLYLRRPLRDYLRLSLEDSLHGLWGGLIAAEKDHFFRSGIKKYDRKRDLTYKDRSSKISVDELFLDEIREKVRVRTIAKDNLRLIPSDLPLDTFSRIFFSTPNTIIQEPSSELINGERVEIPYQREYWFQHLRFWQRIVEELNVGRYSSKGVWNRFYVQRVTPYNAWLFTHGTGQDSHQFWFCVWHTLDVVHSDHDVQPIGGGWYATRVVQSIKVDKISQHLNLLERMVSLRHYWASVFSQNNIRSQRHFSTSLLIALDGKQATIDLLSLFRYVYMEKCKEKGHRNVAKIWTKMPTVLRTPIQSWVAKRMIEQCLADNEAPQIEISENYSEMLNFKSLTSWVDGLPINGFSTILSLSYMHYATSHPVSTGLHGRVSIMAKLISEEEKVPAIKEKIGWSSPLIKELGPHEFSVNFMVKLGKFASKALKARYSTWKEFYDQYELRLLAWKLSDFATFKKSTSVDSDDPADRNYCFEEIFKLKKRIQLNSNEEINYSPYQELNKLVEEQHTNPKSRNVSIFVKDQQTGVREIFVLTMNLRILVKSLEILARLINYALPNETLSLPKRKSDLVYSHALTSQSRKIELIRSLPAEKKYKILELRFSSSSDAKAWCQQFCMPAFGCFYESLLKEAFGEDSQKLRDYMMFVFNQITQKHIHVDSRVKSWFKSNPDVESSDPTFNKLKEMYTTGVGLYPDGGIINESNMMQGIPHETSSCLHASYLLLATNSLKFLVMALRARTGDAKVETKEEEVTTLDTDLKMNNALKGLKLGEVTITNMVSSDDSGILFTLPVALELSEDGEVCGEAATSVESLREILSRFGLAIEECKRLFSAQVSYEKSTIFAETPVYEFNSKFYVGTSVNTAEIKFACSQFTIGYHSSIRERISEAMSSLSTCLSEGMRQDQLMIIQLCLRRMHHRFLYVDWWRDRVHDQLNNLCCPAIGTLPLVEKGLIGFFNSESITEYAAIRKSRFLNALILSNRKSGWGFEESFSLYLKLNTKYSKLKLEYGLDREVLANEVAQIEDGPIKFLLRSLPEDMLIRLKLMTPGAKVSLSFVNLAKIHMSSCYAATTRCISTGLTQEKLTLTECIGNVEHQLSEMPIVTWPVNPTIQRIVEILDNSYEISLNYEQARLLQEIPLYFKDDKSNVSCRQQILDGWRFGFSHERLETLLRATEVYGLFDESFEITLQNSNYDIFEVESLLYKLELGYRSVRFLGFKPPAKGLSNVYSTFLLSNWTRTSSRRIQTDVFRKPDPTPLKDSSLSRHISRLKQVTAFYTGGWKMGKIKRVMRELVMNEFNTWTGTIGEGPIYLAELMTSTSRSSPVTFFDIRRLKFQGSKSFFITPNHLFQRHRGFWYLITDRCGEWEVLREHSAPRKIIEGLKQGVASVDDFTVSTASLRTVLDNDKGLCLRCNGWNSENIKKLPKEIKIKRYEEDTFILEPEGFNINDYIRHLPKEYRTEFCVDLTKEVLGLSTNLNDFAFWEEMSRCLDQEELSQEEKNLIKYSLMKAQEVIAAKDSQFIPEDEQIKSVEGISDATLDLEKLLAEMAAAAAKSTEEMMSELGDEYEDTKAKDYLTMPGMESDEIDNIVDYLGVIEELETLPTGPLAEIVKDDIWSQVRERYTSSLERRRKITKLGRTRYDSLFNKNSAPFYVHAELRGMQIDPFTEDDL